MKRRIFILIKGGIKYDLRIDFRKQWGGSDYEFLPTVIKTSGTTTLTITANKPVKKFCLLNPQHDSSNNDYLISITNVRNGEVISGNSFDMVQLLTSGVTQNAGTYSFSGNNIIFNAFYFSSAARPFVPLVFYN